MGEDTDTTLAHRARTGDRDAFAALVERHYARIHRIGARVLGDAEAGADLAQEVCVALPAKLASWRGESLFTTWLYRVVVNAARDAARRGTVRRRNERRYADADALVRAGNAARARDAAWLRRALDRLPDEMRMTVLLVLDEGLRHADAGAVPGVGESTVSWRMHEARKRLRALALEEGETVP